MWATRQWEGGSSGSAVEELYESLNNQRLMREVTLALKTSLRDARAEFSFLRLRGLRSLLNFLRCLSRSDSHIAAFCKTQSVPGLQVVPVLFQHSLKIPNQDKVESLDHIYGVDRINITSPSTDTEVAVALRVLEGCCLIHRESTQLANQHKGIQVLMRILSNGGVLEQGVCLDALISIMLDSTTNQLDFEELNGIEEVTKLIQDKQAGEKLRLKCGEFLLLFIGHVNGRKRPPFSSVHEEIRRLLGEKSASLVWAASQFGSTLDPEQRLTALQIQARRVLESLDISISHK